MQKNMGTLPWDKSDEIFNIPVKGLKSCPFLIPLSRHNGCQLKIKS
jgi:hypothetical protein